MYLSGGGWLVRFGLRRQFDPDTRTRVMPRSNILLRV